MSSALYTPLPADKFSIRLIKLQPSENTSAPVICKLITYPIASNGSRGHAYECLSYVWGLPEDRKPIHIDTGEAVVAFEATPNLYEALLHLRDPVFEQILWIDAICINQNDDEEKATQVAAMARIYGLAKRVVIWLGSEADGSALAFQRLKDLAQMQQTLDQPAPIDTSSEHGDLEKVRHRRLSSVDSEQAVHALLGRPYFRRMWILQEVTAARNILFKCGDAELQTATFLTGLDALQTLDDWQLRSRILAFLLLIKTSAFRENMKGQSHLAIEPLLDLIDRFHAHDATDPRDKVYALWGLCSDSDAMRNLQPDYTRDWKTLMEELGKTIFGQNSIVSASSYHQMLSVRTNGLGLARVNIIPDAREENLWETTQIINVTSSKATRALGRNCNWNVWVKMRASSEGLLQGDFIMFLPHTGKVIFARPRKYYLRVITVIDGHQAQVLQSGSPENSNDWASWHPHLSAIKDDPIAFPLIWNWEKNFRNEEEDSLSLMRDQLLPQCYETHMSHRTIALTDMRVVFMDYEEYLQSSNLLTDLVDIHTDAAGEEDDVAVANRKLLGDVLDKRATSLQVREVLSRRLGINKPDDIMRLCARSILRNTRTGRLHEALELDTPLDIWIDLASKAISNGVSREMLLQALRDLPRQVDEIASSTSEEHLDTTMTTITKERNRRDALESVPVLHDYLEFLLDMAKSDVYISALELLYAARTPIADSYFAKLCKLSDNPMRNLAQILEVLRSHGRPGVSLRILVAELGDRIVITPDAVNVAVKWDADALIALLKVAKNLPVITPAAFKIAMEHPSSSTRRIIELLAHHAKPGCVIPDTTTTDIITGTLFGSGLNNDDLILIFVALLERTDIVINISAKLLASFVLSKPIVAGRSRFHLLQFRTDCHFDTILQSVEGSLRGGLTTDSFAILSQLNKQAGPIKQEDVDAIPANDITGYASFINLVRYRKDEFKITENLILKTATERKQAPARDSAWMYGPDDMPWKSLLVIDRCTAFLIRHAESDIVDMLSASRALFDIAASRGLPRVLDALQDRSSSRLLHFDTFHTVAELCQALQRPANPGEAPSPFHIISDLVESLAGLEHESVSHNVKRQLYRHAKDDHLLGNKFVDLLIENKIFDTDAVETWDREISPDYSVGGAST